MFARVASLRLKSPRSWLDASISLLTIGMMTLGQPQIGRAADWLQILMQGVQVWEISNLSDAQEASLGAETDRALLSKVKLYRNPVVATYIDRIGQRLARNSTRPKIRYIATAKAVRTLTSRYARSRHVENQTDRDIYESDFLTMTNIAQSC